MNTSTVLLTSITFIRALQQNRPSAGSGKSRFQRATSASHLATRKNGRTGTSFPDTSFPDTSFPESRHTSRLDTAVGYFVGHGAG